MIVFVNENPKHFLMMVRASILNIFLYSFVVLFFRTGRHKYILVSNLREFGFMFTDKFCRRPHTQKKRWKATYTTFYKIGFSTVLDLQKGYQVKVESLRDQFLMIIIQRTVSLP